MNTKGLQAACMVQDVEAMRDLLLAVIEGEMHSVASQAEYRRLWALHEALFWRRAVDLGTNPVFWRVLGKALGADVSAQVARHLQYLH